jgi:hypothetical protein
MLLGCKGQFVPKIVDGSKPHSFRAKRKDGRKWKVGDTIQFYENVRQPNMRKIRPDTVVKGVQDVQMEIYNGIVYLIIENEDAEYRFEGRTFVAKKLEEIAKADGFESVESFQNFFFPKAKEGDTWEGQLVHWTDLKY